MSESKSNSEGLVSRESDGAPTEGSAGPVIAMAVAAAGLAHPVIGFLATWITTRLQDKTNESVQRTLWLLRRRMERLEARLAEHIESEPEIAELVKHMVVIASRSHHEAKLRAAAHLVANQMLKQADADRLVFAEADLFMHAIESLPNQAIELLAIAFRMAKTEPRVDPSHEPVRFDFQRFQASLPQTDPYLLMGLIDELDRFNLLERLGTPGVRGVAYNGYPIELTPLGWRFIKRLLDPSEPD